MDEKNMDDNISVVACNLLTACMDDYDSRIWDVIKDDVLCQRR